MRVLLTALMVLVGISANSQELSKRMQKKKAEFEAKIAAEEKYIELLSSAEYAFEHGRYAEARSHYKEAIKYNQEKEQWLISKINDLDILMAESVAQMVDTVSDINRLETETHVGETEDQLNETDSVESSELAVVEENIEESEDTSNVVEQIEVTKANEKLIEPEVVYTNDGSAKETQADYVYPKPKSADQLLEERDSIDYSDYPVGVTEEIIDLKNHTIQRIVVVDSLDINVYKRVQHNWGGDFTFKNDVSISKRIWLNEVEQAKLFYQKND